MKPREFTAGAAAVAIERDPMMREALAVNLMKRCLVANGFGEGVGILCVAADTQALDIEAERG